MYYKYYYNRYEFYQDINNFYIVSEFLEGEELLKR